MDNNKVYICEEYNKLSDDLLRQIAILRWGHDENKLNNWVNNLRSDPFGFTSFYLFALKDKMALSDNKVIGFAYVCQDDNDETQWYYGDLIIHTEYRRSGIATRIIDMAMRELKDRKASKLFTYIDKDNESSILLHEKLSFIPSKKQDSINGFDKNDRIVYECIL